MLAKGGELKSDHGRSLRIVDFDVELCGLEGPTPQTMLFLRVSVDPHSSACIISHEVFVAKDTSIFTELVRAISWEVLQTKVDV